MADAERACCFGFCLPLHHLVDLGSPRGKAASSGVQLHKGVPGYLTRLSHDATSKYSLSLKAKKNTPLALAPLFHFLPRLPPPVHCTFTHSSTRSRVSHPPLIHFYHLILSSTFFPLASRVWLASPHTSSASWHLINPNQLEKCDCISSSTVHPAHLTYMRRCARLRER